MDVFITDISTGQVTQMPMLPEEIKCDTATAFQSYSVMGEGEVKIPNGEELTKFSWQGTLPGLARGKQPYIKVAVEPTKIQNLLSEYRKSGTKLRLLITETPINHDVYLETFSATYAGGYGDYTYDIAFIVAKDILVRTETEMTTVTTQSSKLLTAAERPKPAASTYTVVKGDSLWSIAQKKLGDGSKYPQLYASNSQNIKKKYIIHPGQVLKL